MHVPFLHRLSFVHARNIVLIAFVFGIITTGNQIRMDLVQARQESGTAIEQVLQIQQEAAAQAAWALDDILAMSVLEGLFSFQPIDQATITSDTGEVLARKKRPVGQPARFDWLAGWVIHKTEYAVQLFNPNRKEAVGTLVLHINSRVIAKPFFERTLHNILSTVIPLIILAGLLVLMFYYQLSKPLFQLSSCLADIDTENPLRSPLEIPPGHEKDELGLVVSTTNNLLQQFAELLLRHKITEHELLAAEKKYRSIFDNSLEGIYQTTLEGRFLTANPYLATTLGYENPAQLMAEVQDIGGQLYADKANRDELLQLLIRDGNIHSFETRFIRKDGQILWGSQSARIVRDDEGKALYIEGTVTDITATKQATADLARLEAQLMQAQKMEALGNLTGGIAHDFNNLLQIIAGNVQLLLFNRDKQHPDYKYLYEVSQAASRASSLIKRMLTFSRKVEVQITPLHLTRSSAILCAFSNAHCRRWSRSAPFSLLTWQLSPLIQPRLNR